MKPKFFSSLLLLISLIVEVDAKVTMGSLWGDGMVLQRNSEIQIGGVSDGVSVKITPSWSEISYTSPVTKNQQWGLKIPTIGAGGPYTITIDDGDKLTIQNVMLGDVWLCMGQSNMSMPMLGNMSQPVEGSARYISQANENRPIRMYTMERSPSVTPQIDAPGEWELNNSKAVANFSAVGYIFGYDLCSALDVPIGLIDVSWGGSSIEAWMSREWLSKVKRCDFSQIDSGVVPKDPTKAAACLYNGMIEPLGGLSVKGGIWYQGEANRFNPNEYLKLFPTFVAGLREHLNSGEFPFYYVQIAPYNYFDKKSQYRGVLMREAMSKLMDLTPRTGMVPITDLGEANNIHPRYKREVGARLSYWALGDCYEREGIEYRAPEYDNIEVVESKFSKNPAISIQFRYAENGISFRGQEPSELFEIAGADRVFYPAEVKLILNSDRPLLVWSDKVAAPVAVRYAFKNYVDGDLYNSAGVALSSFRTDDWEIE